ncbi:MAG TPA: DMT family transporter [Candidatus Cybelea sp.]|nr:DMT family transporter [Candidatus Cybelea sp.]
MPPKTDFARHSLGILFYLAGVGFFAANDALGKYLVMADYGVAELLFVRGVGALAMLLPIAWYVGARMRLSGHWTLHVLRILCQTGDSYCFYYSTKSMPLADVMTFYMATPIIVTAISGLFLKERVGPYRWGAVIFGFVGVVIALAPTSAAFSPVALIALLGSALFAMSLVLTRKLRDNHPLALVAWQFVGGGLIGAAFSPLDWATPDALNAVWMLVVGIVAAGCFLCMARALALAPASLLAPFQYSAIFWAGLLGWIFWHDAPTPRIILGNAMLIASGLFVFYRERRLAVSVSDRVEPIP